MTDRIRLHRPALAELRAAVEWYEQRSPGVGWQLWDEVFDHIDRASEVASGEPLRLARQKKILSISATFVEMAATGTTNC